MFIQVFSIILTYQCISICNKQITACRPNLAHCISFVNKLLRKITIGFDINCDFKILTVTLRAQLISVRTVSSSNRDHMSHKGEIFTLWPFTEKKDVLISFLDDRKEPILTFLKHRLKKLKKREKRKSIAYL